MVDIDQAVQTPLEERTHIFVVKFWQETGTEGRMFWRGHLTHIPSKRRVYIQSLDDIRALIELYLAGAGVE